MDAITAIAGGIPPVRRGGLRQRALGRSTKSATSARSADISTFSFFSATRPLPPGEGGMVVSDDKTLIERVRHLKGQGLAAIVNTGMTWWAITTG